MTITRYFSAPAAHGEASPTGARQAYLMLRTVFTIAPIAFGLDKFFDILTDWEQYLAPWINDLVPGSAHQAMLAVGVVEILAGVLVAVRPAIGAYVVAAWLLGIIVNLSASVTTTTSRCATSASWSAPSRWRGWPPPVRPHPAVPSGRRRRPGQGRPVTQQRVLDVPATDATAPC